jgi:hypothetical protein
LCLGSNLFCCPQFYGRRVDVKVNFKPEFFGLNFRSNNKSTEPRPTYSTYSNKITQQLHIVRPIATFVCCRPHNPHTTPLFFIQPIDNTKSHLNFFIPSHPHTPLLFHPGHALAGVLVPPGARTACGCSRANRCRRVLDFRGPGSQKGTEPSSSMDHVSLYNFTLPDTTILDISRL